MVCGLWREGREIICYAPLTKCRLGKPLLRLLLLSRRVYHLVQKSFRKVVVFPIDSRSFLPYPIPFHQFISMSIDTGEKGERKVTSLACNNSIICKVLSNSGIFSSKPARRERELDSMNLYFLSLRETKDVNMKMMMLWSRSKRTLESLVKFLKKNHYLRLV